MTLEGWVPWLADALALLGLVVMTIGLAGIVRMPDIFTKQHAASKSVFLGVCAILTAVAISGDTAVVHRGEPHWFASEGAYPAISLVVFTPPLDAPDAVPVEPR